MLDFEFRLVFHCVRAASQDGRVQLLELLDGVTKLGRFVDSTGRVGFGIEIKHDIPPAIIRERDYFAVVSLYAKVRSLVAHFQHAALSPRSLKLRFRQHSLPNIIYGFWVCFSPPSPAFPGPPK